MSTLFWIAASTAWLITGFLILGWQSGIESDTAHRWKEGRFMAVLLWPFFLCCYLSECIEKRGKEKRRLAAQKISDAKRLETEFWRDNP